MRQHVQRCNEKNNDRKRKCVAVGCILFFIFALTGCSSSNDLTFTLSNSVSSISTMETTVQTETEQDTDIVQTETEQDTDLNESAETETIIILGDDAPQISASYVVTTSTSNLNIRESPDTNSAIVGKLSDGKTVSGTGNTSDNWVQIFFTNDETGSNITGWVSGNYLSADNNDNSLLENSNSESGEDDTHEIKSEQLTGEKQQTTYENNTQDNESSDDDYSDLELYLILATALEGGDQGLIDLYGDEMTDEFLQLCKDIVYTVDYYYQKGILGFDETGSFVNLANDNQQSDNENIQTDNVPEELQPSVQLQICSSCGGSGQTFLESRAVCAICGGSGMQYIPNAIYDTIMGWQGTYVGCGGCGGNGYIDTSYYQTCVVCGGTGCIG